MSTDPQAELIARAQSGDVGAFRDLMRPHRQRVVSLIHRMLGPSGDIEDVAQEVYLHVHRSLGSFRGDARFTTWLYRLTTNVVRMHIRKARSRPRLLALGGSDEPVFERVDARTPGHEAEQSERVRALYRGLQTLSDKKRDVLVMHDLQGMPAAEIAEVVDAPVLTVRTRLFYARKELYAALSHEPAFADTEVAPTATSPEREPPPAPTHPGERRRR